MSKEDLSEATVQRIAGAVLTKHGLEEARRLFPTLTLLFDSLLETSIGTHFVKMFAYGVHPDSQIKATKYTGHIGAVLVNSLAEDDQ